MQPRNRIPTAAGRGINTYTHTGGKSTRVYGRMWTSHLFCHISEGFIVKSPYTHCIFRRSPMCITHVRLRVHLLVVVDVYRCEFCQKGRTLHYIYSCTARTGKKILPGKYIRRLVTLYVQTCPDIRELCQSL